MSLIVRQYSYSNGSTADANQANPNESTCYTAINGNLDHTNIGSAGIYASQLNPTTTAEATMGGSIGLLLGGYAQTVVPLTVYGNASQTADLLDILATSGGTKLAWLTSAGALNVGSNAQASVAGQIGMAGSATSGSFRMGGATTSIQLDFNSTTTNCLTITSNTGSITPIFEVGSRTSNAGGIIGWPYGSGSIQIFSQSGTTISTVAGTGMVIATNGGTGLVALNASNGNFGVLGSLNQASDRARKTNITPWSGSALADVLAMRAYRYNLIGEEDGEEQHTGFIADEAPASLVRGGTAVEPYSVAVMGMLALQEFYAEFVALKAKVAGAS